MLTTGQNNSRSCLLNWDFRPTNRNYPAKAQITRSVTPNALSLLHSHFSPNCAVAHETTCRAIRSISRSTLSASMAVSPGNIRTVDARFSNDFTQFLFLCSLRRTSDSQAIQFSSDASLGRSRTSPCFRFSVTRLRTERSDWSFGLLARIYFWHALFRSVTRALIG